MSYQSVPISTSGVGGVPNPAGNSNWDWLWKQKWSLCDYGAASGFTNFWAFDNQGNEIMMQTRAMRKLSHAKGLLLVIGWDWDDFAFSQNGDTLEMTVNVAGRSIFKEP